MWCASDDHADVHADTKAKHKTGPILEAAAGTQPHRSLASQHMNPPCQHVSLAGQHVLFIEKRTSIALCFDSPAPIVAIHFSSEFLAEFMLDAAWSGVFARPWYELLKVDTRIGALFECARELCQHQRQRQAAQPLGRGALKGRAQLSSHYIHALGVMLAALLLNAQSVPQPGGKSAGLTPEQLKKAQAYIEAHFTESFRITALYRFVGLSERRFGRLFKNSTGMLPRRYILARRVTYAQELLRTGHLRIAEVANAAGFADQSHMRHCFRLLCSAEPPRRKRLQPA
jgi:AraC-like DNA-binding protein